MNIKRLTTSVFARLIPIILGTSLALAATEEQVSRIDQSVRRQIVKRAFSDSAVTEMESAEAPQKTVFRVAGSQGSQGEKLSLSEVLSTSLADKRKVVVWTAEMDDRIKTIREMIDRQTYSEQPETAYLLIAIQTKEGDWDVHKKSCREQNEVKGTFEDVEFLSLLGGNTRQVAVTYVSLLQTDEWMGAKKKRIIYDLPTGREILAVGLFAETTRDVQKKKWRLSYHDDASKKAKVIHLTQDGNNRFQRYDYNGSVYVSSDSKSPESAISEVMTKRGELYSRRRLQWNENDVAAPPKSRKVGESIQRMVFDGLKDAELVQIVKGAYPDATNIELVRRVMRRARLGNPDYWTGEVEFLIEDKKHGERKRFLACPSKCVFEDGSAALSGLLQPNPIDRVVYKSESRRKAERNKTEDAVFAIVTIGHNGKTIDTYRDVIRKECFGLTDISIWKQSIHSEPKHGFFRKVFTWSFRREESGGHAEALLQEGQIRIYELTAPRLVLSVPYYVEEWKGKQRTVIYSDGAEVSWKDLDDDQVAELLVKDANGQKPTYVYKFEEGLYRYWKHGELDKAEKPYRPGSMNSSFRVQIIVADENNHPVENVKVRAEIKTKHQNILDLWAEPKMQRRTLRKQTNKEGTVVIEGKAFVMTIFVEKEGYAKTKHYLRPFAEPVPEVLNVVLKKQ